MRKGMRKLTAFAASLTVAAASYAGLASQMTANAAYGVGGNGKAVMEYLDRGIYAVKNGNELDKVLFFRECGVAIRKPESVTATDYDFLLSNWTPIQIWRLTHNPSTMETKLIRVRISKEWK